MQTLLLLLVPQKCQLHFSLFLSLVGSLFQLCMPAVTFCPLLLHCLLLLEKTFVQVQTAKGPSSHSVSLSREGFKKNTFLDSIRGQNLVGDIVKKFHN